MTGAPLTQEDKERIQEAFERVPFAHLLELELGEMRRGAATLHLNLSDRLKQNNDVVHGGVIASLADTAAAFAILTLAEIGQTSTTVDLTVHYLLPLTEGRATANARVLRDGRRVIVVAVDVLNEAQALAATAIMSFLRLT